MGREGHDDLFRGLRSLITRFLAGNSLASSLQNEGRRIRPVTHDKGATFCTFTDRLICLLRERCSFPNNYYNCLLIPQPSSSISFMNIEIYCLKQFFFEWIKKLLFKGLGELDIGIFGNSFEGNNWKIQCEHWYCTTLGGKNRRR